MNVRKCYMVYKDGKHGCKPRKKHETITSAMEEATRLAGQCPDRFLVVEVIGAVQLCDEGLRAVEAK